MEKETAKCACGESVLSTEKFCKNCGKPLEQKSENNVVKENPNKKVVLTFEALDDKSIKDASGQDAKITYSIEVDGNFIGKINPGEKIDTFVAKGKHNIILKRNKGFFMPTEEQISVEDNQTILVYSSYSLYSLYFYFPAFLTNPSDLEKEKILQRNMKTTKMGNKALLIFWVILLIISLIGFLVR